MAPKKKLYGMTALVLGALVFMLWLAGLLHFGKIAPGTVSLHSPPVPGRGITVQEVEIPQELTVLGSVMSTSLAQVAAQVPGRVSRIWVESGSRVQAGAPLVALTAPEYQARLSQAQAQLSQAAADYRRYQRLLKEEAVSPREFGAMEARYRTARAQVAEATTMSGYTLVKASDAGVVAERKTAVGDLAQPGQSLLTLYSPNKLQIEGEVNDSYRQQIRLGEMVRVSVPALPWQTDLPLAEIFPISQANSRTFKVRTAMIQNPELVPGMFARLELRLAAARGLLIPQAAVRQVGQLSMVDAVVDGRPTRRQVQLGRQVGEQVEVLAGLQAGDKIMLPE